MLLATLSEENRALTEAYFMKRPVVTALFLCAVATLSGCPIYNHEDAGCYHSSDCAPGFVCDVRSGDCYQPSSSNSCSRPQDCAVDATCGRAAECIAGDCSFPGTGCVSGYTCDSSSGVWACVPSGSAGSAEAGAAGASSGGSDTAGQGGAP
jgi:hypothetical protein